MTTFDDLKPSKYLKAFDVGEGTVVTISRWAQEEVGKDKDRKIILYFNETEKGLVLNKVNANKISTLCASAELEDWPGHKIMLYSAEVEFGGDMVPGIRVKPARTKPASHPRQDPISTGHPIVTLEGKPSGVYSDFPGDRPMPKRRAAVDQDLDDDIEF